MREIYYEAKKDVDKKLFAELQGIYGSKLHFHRAFEIAYVFDGECKYRAEDSDFVAKKDDIFFAHCYYSHMAYEELENKKYVIAVPDRFSSEISALFEDSTLPYLLADREFNKELLPYFEKLATDGAFLSDIIIKGYLFLIFGSLVSHYEKVAIKQKNKNISLIVEVLNYIDAHLDENITLGSVSSHFGYNKSYFSRRFNSYVGVSFNDYLNGARLDRYEALVKEKSGRGVTELAFLAGFQSLSTFYRARELRARGST